MADLERALRELPVDWPGTPDIATAVRARLPERPRRNVRAWAAAVVLAALGATAAIEPARSAVLEFLGLRSVRIERRAPDPTPRPFGAELDLGRPSTLAAAARSAGLSIAPPAELGEPDGVWLSTQPAGIVSLVYGPLPRGLLIQVVDARVEDELIGKSAGPGVRIERVRGGYFLSGALHGVGYARENGEFHFEEQRLAGNTLLVERGGVLVRIEGRIARERALRLAATMRATTG